MDQELIDIFTMHLRNKLAIEVDTREEQLRHEAGLISGYRGRVMVELFQNAIDRADRRIVYRKGASTLLVANDNRNGYLKVEGNRERRVHDGRLVRSDFHVICATNTSQKVAWEAIGNKGIGFKSVFRDAEFVDIWSRRHGDGAWWGFRMRHPFRSEHALQIAQGPPPSELWPGWGELWGEVAEKLGDIPAPSFYFPQFLPEEEVPELDEDLVTAVRLTLKEKNSIEDQWERFIRTRLHFVPARYPDKAQVAVDGHEVKQPLQFHDGWGPWPEVPHPLPHRAPFHSNSTPLCRHH